MSEFAIRAEGLGKKCHLGERERYVALRDVMARPSAREIDSMATPGKATLVRRWLIVFTLRVLNRPPFSL
jgi:hypothetical protein